MKKQTESEMTGAHEQSGTTVKEQTESETTGAQQSYLVIGSQDSGCQAQALQ